MKMSHWISQLLLLIVGILSFQLVQASPPGALRDSEDLVIVQDGSVKLRSELLITQ